MLASITFARYIYDHPLCNTGRDIDFNHFFTFYDAFAVTMVTFVLYDFSFSTAYMTCCLCLHHTKDALLGTYLHTGAVAVGTGFTAAPVFCSCSVTVFAFDILPYLELLCYTSSYLL